MQLAQMVDVSEQYIYLIESGKRRPSYVENADESAILTVTLSPTSSSIPFLEDMCFSRASQPVTVNDASEDARMTYYSPKCRVQKPADKSRGPNASTVSYNIILPAVQKIA